MLELPLYAWSRARSAHFRAQYILFSSLSLLLPGNKGFRPQVNASAVRKALGEINALLKRDALNMTAGLYPASVLLPEAPIAQLLSYPKMLADSYDVYRRRIRGRTTEFDAKARERLDEVPRYYRRNFHYQSGGYLSEKSAAFYDYQVEMLFSGTGDAMRRLLLPPLKRAFPKNPEGKGLRLLEIGAGTGRATRSVRMAFPKARIVALDLSEPYLKAARKSLERFERIDYVQGDGARLPFKDAEFDAVYSVFMFHELPAEERRKILAEARRVLKKGGFLGLVDSIQLGDEKAFDGFLHDFPKLYHEPFYRDYVSRPLEGLVRAAKFRNVRSVRGFLSKACWAVKA